MSRGGGGGGRGAGGAGLAGLYDLKKEEDVKEYLKNLHTEYSYQCYGEKLPDGCHRLADFYEAFQRDENKARELFQSNCDNNGHGHSCYKLGTFNMTGLAGPKSYPDAYKCYLKGCDGGHLQSCHNAALMHDVGYLVKDKSKRDFVKATELLTRSCSKGHALSCNLLSTYHLTGQKDVPKDMQKAFAFAEKACSLDHVYACVNVSVMYKRGDGVEKNLELSKQFESKARRLHRDNTTSEKTITMSE